MSGGLSTHVLDTARGLPAVGVPVRLYRGDALLAEAVTDADGRCRPLYSAERVTPGEYRLWFGVGRYFAAQGMAVFYPEVSVVFLVEIPGAGYHLPLLLNPFGYTTYRGS